MPFKISLFILVTQSILFADAQAQLKYVVYDFEGCNIGQTNLPEADYHFGDISYEVVETPGGDGLMIGDRVLQVAWNSSTGEGGWGRSFENAHAKFTDLNFQTDHFNFYILNPANNSKDLNLAIYIQDDDNYNNAFEYASDDDWMVTIDIGRSNDWQLISIPLSLFADQNPGGDGVFNIGYSKGTTFAGIQLRPINLLATDPIQNYFFDMISFSEGNLPTGLTILDAPEKLHSDYCLLGAFTDVTSQSYNMTKIPEVFEGKLNPPGSRKLCITNYFVEWSFDGSNTPNNYINVSWANNLVASGYVPMITWEPWFTNIAFDHPSQPSLSKINSGNYDSYINSFADQVKLISDTVQIRLMHEMNGNWYPWCIAVNGANNAAHVSYINAWKKIVDMFSARGVTNVQWVWCVNAEAVPYDMAYNNFVNSYPGDAYVDIIGFDIYNHPITSYIPYWRSFRLDAAPVYYSLSENFPSKPIYICEISCRERYSGHVDYGTEDITSESKAQWIDVLDQELESNFSKVRALIWFDINKEHDWRINSSSASLNAFQNSFWDNLYYSNCTLPLSLGFISIDASLQDGNSVINFQTNEAGDIQFYRIQFSYDGINFTTKDTIESNGNIGINTYQWEDAILGNGTIFYRVTQHNHTNQISISEVVSLILTSSYFYSIQFDPFLNNLTLRSNLELHNIYSDPLKIFIYDISGKRVAEHLVQPAQSIEIKQELNKGIFLIRVINSRFSQCTPLIRN